MYCHANNPTPAERITPLRFPAISLEEHLQDDSYSEMKFSEAFIVVTLLSKLAWLPLEAQPGQQVGSENEGLFHFEIPSAPAEIALERYSDIVKRPIIYLLEDIKGIQLNEVVGSMSPEEAIRQLVDNTELILVEDNVLDTWVVKLKGSGTLDSTGKGSSNAPGDSAGGKLSSSRRGKGLSANENQEARINMKNSRTSRNKVFTGFMKGLSSLIFVGGAAESVAQDPSQLDEDDVFELSPFVVDGSQDVGYTAQSTLAGTRIATQVRELGASISIITEQFLDDTGTTDAQSLLTYTANTEVGGALGNYSAGDEGAGIFNANNARRNPQNAQRVRGLSRAELTRDFYSTSIPFDGYNTSRVTINRGPNSVLFGIGSPGGVIDHSLKTPVLNGDSNQVRLRFDHRGSYRGTFDVNRTLIDDRLAIRVAGVYDKRKYKQEPAEEEDTRIYLAWDGVIFKNEGSEFLGKTNLRGHVEFGDIYRNPPDPIPPIDASRFWFNGYTDVDSLLAVPGIELSDLNRNLLTTEQADNGRFIPKVAYDNINDVGDNNTKTRTASFINIPLFYESGDQQAPGWSDPALAGLSGGMSRIRWPGSSGRGRQDFLFAGNAIRDLVGFSGYSLQDTSQFDYRNRLFQGTMNSVDSYFHVQQLALEQSFWDGMVGIELGYNHQTFEQTERTPLSSGLEKELYIDISQFLSNDVPNPNFGRPVVRMNNFTTNKRKRVQDTLRATAYVDVDIKDYNEGLGKWLGRHTLTGLFEQRDNDQVNTQDRFAWESDTIAVATNEAFASTVNSGRRAVSTLVYVGPSAVNASTFGDVPITDQVNVPWPVEGQRHTAWYWDHIAKERKVGEFFPTEFRIGADLGRTELTSEAVSLKSNFLDNHLVTVLAWRQDREKAFERLISTGTFAGDLPLRNPDGSANANLFRLQDDPSSDFEDETITKSVVGFFPEEYLFELPFGMDFSAHYYEGESFQPAGFSQNIFGETISAPVGETEEYGFTLEFLKRRLSLRVNFFETSNTNNRTNVNGTIVNATGRIGDWLRAFQAAEEEDIPFADLEVGSAASSYSELYATIINLVPEPTRSLLNYQVDSEQGRVTSDDIQNLTSTFDFVSEGMEVELIGAIKPNWSVSLNVAEQETVRSNTAPAFSSVVLDIERNITESGLANVRDNPTLGVDITILERYQNVVSFPVRAELANDGRKSLEQRQWRVNLVSSYDFLEGKAKGFGIGGALRWQDRSAIGYPLLVDDGGNQIPDLDNAFFGDDELNGDIWFSYKKRLRDKINWRIQLNVRNAIRSDTDIPVVINPNGELAVVRMPPEQQIFVTNTFRF